MIEMDQVNEVFETLAAGNDGDFRHVIDIDKFRESARSLNGSATKVEAPSR